MQIRYTRSIQFLCFVLLFQYPPRLKIVESDYLTFCKPCTAAALSNHLSLPCTDLHCNQQWCGVTGTWLYKYNSVHDCIYLVIWLHISVFCQPLYWAIIFHFPSLHSTALLSIAINNDVMWQEDSFTETVKYFSMDIFLYFLSHCTMGKLKKKC